MIIVYSMNMYYHQALPQKLHFLHGFVTQLVHLLIMYIQTYSKKNTHFCILVRPISDHQMYFCMMNENYINPKTKQKYVQIEVCNEESLEKFKAEIANAEIYARLQKDLTDDPNTNYKILSQILKIAKNRHILKKIKRV